MNLKLLLNHPVPRYPSLLQAIATHRHPQTLGECTTGMHSDFIKTIAQMKINKTDNKTHFLLITNS
jgi:hypothetical protein